MTFVDDWESELAELEQTRVQRRQREWLQATTSTDVADRLSRSFALYDADPEIHLAFAEAGVDPVENADVWASATAANQIAARGTSVGVTGPAGRLVEDPPQALWEADELIGFSHFSEEENDAFRQVLPQMTTAGVTADDVARAVSGGALDGGAFLSSLTAMNEARDRAKQTGGGGSLIGSALGIAKQVLPGVSTAGAVGDFIRDNPVTDNLIEPVLEFARTNPGTDRLVEPTVNIGVSVLDYPYQMTQAAFRNAYEDYQNRGLGGFIPEEFSADAFADFATDKVGDLFEAHLQTNVGAMTLDAVEDLPFSFVEGERTYTLPDGTTATFRPVTGRDGNRIIGEGFNIGEGFFFDGPAEDFRQRMERQQGTIDGLTVTIGRWAASPLDAGSTEHRLLSGVIDGALALAGPGELAIDSTFKSIRAHRAFRSTEGNAVAVSVGDALIDASTADEAIPLLRSTGVQTFSDDDVARVVKASTRDEVAEALARMDSPEAPAVADDAASALDAPPRRPSDIDLDAPLPESAFDAIRARWGALRGVRPTVDPQRVRHFLDSPRGTRVTQQIAEITDTRQLDRMLRTMLPGERLSQYAAATDPTEVRRLLNEDLGVNLAATPRSPRRPATVDAVRGFAPRPARLASAVPGGFFDLHDSRQLLDQVDDVLVNTGASPATLSRWHNRFTHSIGRASRFRALREMYEEIGLRSAIRGVGGKGSGVSDLEKSITRWADETGTPVDEAWERILDRNVRNPTGVAEVDDEIETLRVASRRLSTLFSDHLSAARAYDVDLATGELRDPLAGDVVRAGDETHKVSKAGVHLQSEMISRLVPVPDARATRRFFSDFRGLMLKQNGDLRAATKVYDLLLAAQQGIWKPSVLLRFAWPVRVVGEEQFRLAAGGYSSMARHPVHHMSVLLGNRGAVERSLKRLGYDIGDPTRRAAGDFGSDAYGVALSLDDAHTRAMSTGSGRRATRAQSSSYTVIETAVEDQQRVLDAWAEEMAKLSHDPVGVLILQSDSLDEAREVFWEGMGGVRREIREGRPNAAVNVMERAGADAYIDTVARRIDEVTSENPDLLDVMRSRRIGEVAMGGGGGQLNPEFARALEAHRGSVPRFLPARETLSAPLRESGFASLDRATEWVFTQLMAKPTDNLSRSPVFRQEYWNEVQAVAPRLARADANQIVAAAEQANLPRGDIAQLRRTIGRDTAGVPPEAVGTLSLREVDEWAKATALTKVQDLLFDLSQRNQMFDALALAFPFGDAWAEVVTRWARLIRDDPQVVRRASQAIEGGRETGFIFENERGEDVFAYPVTGWLSEEAATGTRVPFVGRLEGLSLMTDVLPGLGPVVQLPLAMVIPDGPEWDYVRSRAFPFGQPDVKGNPINTAVDQFVPPAWRRIAAGIGGEGATPDEQRQYASVFGALFAQKGASGEYDVENPDPKVARDEWHRLVGDAQDATARFSWFRGALQLTVPSSPAPDWFLEGPTTEKVQFSTLREMYNRVFEENPEDPIGEFVDTYGVWALAAVQGRTVSFGPGRGLPPTREAEQWARANPDLGDEFSLVYGFFAPQGGEFDFDAYGRILDRGERIPLTEDQQVSRFLHTQGVLDYSRERERTREVLMERGWDGEGNMPVEARRYLADYDKHLTEIYAFKDGGYAGRANRWSGPGRASKEESITQLRAAVTDERLEDHPVAEASRRLFDAMDEADEVFRERNSDQHDAGGWETSKAGRPYREYVADVANVLVRETPEFSSVYESVFEPVFAEGLRRDEQEDSE